MIAQKNTPLPNRPQQPAKTPELRLASLSVDADAQASCLRFSPTAWAKLLYLRDAGQSEVGGFGISAADDLLLIEDVQLVRQACDRASVLFDDASVADFFDRQVDAGRKPPQFARLWMHTHPGGCPQPSSTDEQTFARVFGSTDWSVMLILARGGRTYARLEFHVGPGGAILLPVEVDYRRPFQASNHAAWQEEYLANVHVQPWPAEAHGKLLSPPVCEELLLTTSEQDYWLDRWEHDLLEEDLLAARIHQRQEVASELSI